MNKSKLSELANASSMSLLRGDLNIVAVNLQLAQDRLEAATGGSHSWLDPVVAIARSRASDPLPEAARLEALEAENAKLKEALFGKHGMASGIAVIEKCLAVSVKADHADAPFPFDDKQAAFWHRSQVDAFRHALEMISIDPSILALRDSVEPKQHSDVDQAKPAEVIVGNGNAFSEGLSLCERRENATTPIPGFVLAFPGASDVEAEELLVTLRWGGNTVFRVEGEVAKVAIADALNAAALDASDLESSPNPSM